MIITCPSCSARYRVGDEMIQAKGKRIKCKKCEAVFVAYPDRDAVLESTAPLAAAASPQPTPAAAAPQPPRPVAPTAVPVAPPAPSVQPAAPMASQATVKVDRSNLDKFLQQAGSLDGTQSTLKVDPEQFKSYLQTQQAPGATVQVDRSQIDAFLHESAKGGGAEPPFSGPSSSETVAMDSRALSSALGLTPPGSAPRPVQPANDFVPPTPSLSGFGGASGSFDQVDDPPFPSDEELGLGNELSVEMPSPIPKPAPAPPAPAPPAPVPPPAPPKVEPAPAPVAAKPAAYVEEILFQADVEGKIYPNLSLDAIGRWVREGRLLEQDLIAPNGSSDYHAAETYPEFRTFFDELNASQEVEPVKKKGFFARLFSFGKK